MNKQWDNNLCQIYAYKSNRSNAKIISDITMRHLITHNENGCCDESIIENYFVGIIGQLTTDLKFSSNGVINITTYMSINQLTTYTNANNELYNHYHTIQLHNRREKFSSIEQLINYLYDILLLIYPYTRLDLHTIYENESIKYFIHMYYHSTIV